MTTSATPWTGTWIDTTDPLTANEDVLLAVASYRECAPERVSEELERIEERFDVDAVYVERD